MRSVKHLLTTTLLLCLLFAYTLQAYADETDLERNSGSISIELKTAKGEVPEGGSLLLYKVAELSKGQDQTLAYTYTEDFQKCPYQLADLESEKLVENLLNYISKEEVSGRLVELDEHGSAKLEDLALGIYLIKQNKAAEGFKDIKPFLISIPMIDENGLLYDVSATPKTQLLGSGGGGGGGTPPGGNPPGGGGGGGGGGRLPQTGQLWWPVPILAFAGLVSFSIGWKRKKKYEEQ